MDMRSDTLAIIALLLALVSLTLGMLAYWRSGVLDEIEAVGARQRLVTDELSRRIRRGIEDSLARVSRASQRLAQLQRGPSMRLSKTIDELAAELANVRAGLQEVMRRVQGDVSEGAEATAEALARRIRHIESRIQVLMTRAEIRAAEDLADAGRFVAAEDLLEDAVARVRELSLRYADEPGEEPAFAPVIEALHGALHSLRERAADHKRRIDSVLSASDSLLAALASREHAVA
jgi:hypothetical protein